MSIVSCAQSAAAQDFVVTGRVYDAATSAGVENARVSLGDGGSTLSGDFGAFELRAVPAGEYQVVVEALGYGDLRLSLDLVADTVLLLPLAADPIELEGLDVTLETLDFDGVVRDPSLESPVYEAEVRSDQGHRDWTSRTGRFDLDDVYDGPPIRLVIRGFGYLPLDTTLIPDQEGRHPFDLSPDPVVTRMIETYVTALDDRAGERMYEYQSALNRAELARFPPNATLRRVMESKYPLHILRRIQCFFVDEQEYRWFDSMEERLSLLEGTSASELERVEVLEFPGEARLLMARVYTRRFFQRQVGSPDPLVAPSVTATWGGTFCR